MKSTITTVTALLACMLTTSSAFGGYIITQDAAPGPVLAGPYITFDEPGVPTGLPPVDPLTFYQATDGVVFQSNSVPSLIVDDWDLLEGIAGGNGSGNQLNGGFGIRMDFSPDVNALRFQGWDPGSPNPPIGGVNVFVFEDGNQVATYSGISPFGGVGDEWFTVTADGGDSFDEVVVFGGAFNSFRTYVDNVNFEVVPEPHAIALSVFASMACLCFRRRR